MSILLLASKVQNRVPTASEQGTETRGDSAPNTPDSSTQVVPSPRVRADPLTHMYWLSSSAGFTCLSWFSICPPRWPLSPRLCGTPNSWGALRGEAVGRLPYMETPRQPFQVICEAG